MKYFVVSDVHSFYDELMLALNKKGFDVDNKEHILVVCGDLFDRGNQTVQLYDFVRSLPDDRFIYIRGNHEDLLEDCVACILNGEYISSYHHSNGTVKTVDAFLNSADGNDINNLSLQDLTKKAVVPVIEWINKKTVDYAILGDTILVHGWLPQEDKWNDKKAWEDARWDNGMEMWKKHGKFKDYTVICGHFHCSWGWSHLRQKYKEFPQKTHEDFNKSFEPFVDDGIIAIDGCVAYSRKVNCIVIEVEE